MSKHAVFSPSSAERWTKCSASIVLGSECEEQTTSVAAEFGTFVHEVAEIYIGAIPNHAKKHRVMENLVTQGSIDEKVPECYKHRSEEVFEHVSNYVAYAFFKYIEGASMLWAEVKTSINDDIWGTADCVILNEQTRKLTVIDLKTGIVQVPADSIQLQVYALGVIGKMLSDYMPYPSSVELVICQFSEYEQCVKTVTIEDPQAYFSELKTALDIRLAKVKADIAQYKEHKFLTADAFRLGSWCKYCKALKVCPSQFKQTKEVMVTRVREPFDLSAQRVSELLNAKTQIEKYLKAVEDDAKTRILLGEEVEGFELKKALSNRAWLDQEKVITFFERRHPTMLKDIMIPSVLKSPTKLEKLSPRVKEELKKFTVRRPLGDRLVKTKSTKTNIITQE